MTRSYTCNGKAKATKLCVCNGKDKAVPFRKHNDNVNTVLLNSSKARCANKRGGNIPWACDGDAKTAHARKYDRFSGSVTTINNLHALAKEKMDIKMCAPLDAIVRSPQPPLFGDMSSLIKMVWLQATALLSAKM